jgi:hypothetical protein
MMPVEKGKHAAKVKMVSLPTQMKTISQHLLPGAIESMTIPAYDSLQRKFGIICLTNFVLLSLVGLTLRAYPLTAIIPFSYNNLLHAHSHFAFGGWVSPALLLLLLYYFPELKTAARYSHWRNIFMLTVVAAYGMLLSFPFQGYGPVSLVFSTLSITAGFYAGILVFRSKSSLLSLSVPRSFLLAGFFFNFMAALGPFATGPLIAMGKAGTALYFNAIYFYLHFQYNGFFTFIVLAIVYKIISPYRPLHRGETAFRLYIIACFPAYLLSVLWSHASGWLNIAGGAAAFLQLVATAFLWKDVKGIAVKGKIQNWLFRYALIAFVLKNVLQWLSAFPSVAQLAYQNRNFIIAYLHLVLVGFISFFILSTILRAKTGLPGRLLQAGIALLFFAFITTELLMVLQASGYLHAFNPVSYLRWLWGLSIFYPVGLIITLISQLKGHVQ